MISMLVHLILVIGVEYRRLHAVTALKDGLDSGIRNIAFNKPVILLTYSF